MISGTILPRWLSLQRSSLAVFGGLQSQFSSLSSTILRFPTETPPNSGVRSGTSLETAPAARFRMFCLRTVTQAMLLILSVVGFTALAMIVHEFGHLVIARLCSVNVCELGLGLGPRLAGFRLGGIRFSLRIFPVGSFVILDGLRERPVWAQLLIHLGGIIFNLIAFVLSYGTMFGWLNLLLAAGNILPLYQHDGWKCGVVIMRASMQRKSQPAERAFTFSAGFVSLVIACAVLRMFL
jgi:membrane-associated protease RseP (regulator of RpoE activity)